MTHLRRSRGHTKRKKNLMTSYVCLTVKLLAQSQNLECAIAGEYDHVQAQTDNIGSRVSCLCEGLDNKVLRVGFR